MTEVGDVDLIQDFLNTLAHYRRSEVVVLHSEGQFIFHGVNHELALWVLKHKTHDLAHPARPQGQGIATSDADCAADGPTVEVGHQSIQAPQQR